MSALDYGNLPQPQSGTLNPNLTPQMLAHFLGSGAGAGAVNDTDEPEENEDPLQTLQTAIHAVAEAVSALPDPQDTQEAIGCLLALSKIQTRLMSAQQGSPGAPPPR